MIPSVYLGKKKSITYFIPGTVIELSAIFVERITFLYPSGCLQMLTFYGNHSMNPSGEILIT